MSDTAYYSGALREAFPRDRHGAAKSAIYAAYRYIAPKVRKQFTERRARSIWEGTAARIDAEEARVEASLAVVDEAFFGPQMDAYRSASASLGRLDRTGTGPGSVGTD